MKTIRITLLLALCFLFSTCQQDEDFLPETHSDITYEHIDPSQDDFLKTSLINFTPFQINQSNNLRTAFGVLDFTDAIKVTNPFKNLTRYTLLLQNSNENIAFENLIVREREGEVNAYILRYEPDIDWLIETGSFEVKSLTGKVIAKELDGRVITVVDFENGRSTKISNTVNPDNSKTACENGNTGGGGTGIGSTGGGDSGGNTGEDTGAGNNGNGGSGGGDTGTPCSWGHSETTGGLRIDCDGVLYFFRTACDLSGSGNNSPTKNPKTKSKEDPIGVIPKVDLTHIANLEIYLEENPEALIDLPCSELIKWQRIASFKPPTSVVNKIKDLKKKYSSSPFGVIDIQSLEKAGGKSVNLDYFPIKVSKLPSGYTADDLLQKIRLNINDFVDTRLSEFSPYKEVNTGFDEGALWKSNNPIGAILHISIPFDEGSVICSDYTSRYWRFSTILTPWDQTHPVSGTREFGYTKQKNGSYIFYTRGVDRITYGWHEFMAKNETFEGADGLWKSFQKGVSEFVKKNGGTAIVDAPVIGRPNWDHVRDVLLGLKPIESLGCK